MHGQVMASPFCALVNRSYRIWGLLRDLAQRSSNSSSASGKPCWPKIKCRRLAHSGQWLVVFRGVPLGGMQRRGMTWVLPNDWLPFYQYPEDGVVLPSVTEILKRVGLLYTKGFSRESANFGTEVSEATTLIDLKTRKAKLWHPLQLAGY
jgi:hypothetical protein